MILKTGLRADIPAFYSKWFANRLQVGFVCVRNLSDMVGVDSVGWRYDPILISDVYPMERHISDFEKMAAYLSGYTKACVISFFLPVPFPPYDRRFRIAAQSL